MLTPRTSARLSFGTHLEDLAGAALVLAGEDDDLVALLDLRRHHSTSGASEMIFMWFLARSSRGTGPKMRVPIGSLWLLISTAALRSKRMTEPSARRMSLRAHDDGLHHVALLHAAARDRFLDRDDDDVADRGVLALASRPAP